jgi:hypothetical protein
MNKIFFLILIFVSSLFSKITDPSECNLPSPFESGTTTYEYECRDSKRNPEEFTYYECYSDRYREVTIAKGSPKSCNLKYQYTVSFTNYYTVDSCPDGESKDENGICSLPKCVPLSSVKLSLSQAKCSGLVTDWAQGYSGQAVYQECDSTCYLTESSLLTCEGAAKNFTTSCDPLLNTPTFKCTDGVDGSAYTLESSCIPKNTEPLTSPCEKISADKKIECESQGEVVADGGVCRDNGVVITDNTLECVPKTPDCSTKWHEVLNTSTNECECQEGYVLNSFGDCWKPLFPSDSNLTDEQKVEEQKAEQENNNAKKLDDTNEANADSLSDLSDKVSSLTNTASGVRRDLNTTNALLKDIKDTLNGKKDDDEDSKNAPSHDDDNNKLLSYLSGAKDGMDDIASSFGNLKSVVDNGFSAPAMSVGTHPVFETVVFKHTIKIELCDTFSRFRDIFYWVFYLSFMYMGIRIFIYSFLIGV